MKKFFWLSHLLWVTS